MFLAWACLNMVHIVLRAMWVMLATQATLYDTLRSLGCNKRQKQPNKYRHKPTKNCAKFYI